MKNLKISYVSYSGRGFTTVIFGSGKAQLAMHSTLKIEYVVGEPSSSGLLCMKGDHRKVFKLGQSGSKHSGWKLGTEKILDEKGRVHMIKVVES